MEKISKADEKSKNIHRGHRQRLRDMIVKDSELDIVTDIQLLEYIISFGIPQKDTNPIAHELINRFGGIYNVFCANVSELKAVKGMTENAAHLVCSLLSCSRRIAHSRVNRASEITKVKSAVEFLQPLFFGLNYEMVYLLCTDINGKLIGNMRISKGGSNFASMELSKLVEAISRNKAANIILAHNHPGGSLIMSNEDRNITGSAVLLCGVVGANVLDHIIFTDDGYYSFFESGVLAELYDYFDKATGGARAKAFREADAQNYLFEKSKRTQRQLSADEQQRLMEESKKYYKY